MVYFTPPRGPSRGKIQGNLGLTNLNGPKVLFFIAGVLLLLGLLTIKSPTDVTEIEDLRHPNV
jgi:hypothetical protein